MIDATPSRQDDVVGRLDLHSPRDRGVTARPRRYAGYCRTVSRRVAARRVGCATRSTLRIPGRASSQLSTVTLVTTLPVAGVSWKEEVTPCES
jgi:hypothetical protein